MKIFRDILWKICNLKFESCSLNLAYVEYLGMHRMPFNKFQVSRCQTKYLVVKATTRTLLLVETGLDDEKSHSLGNEGWIRLTAVLNFNIFQWANEEFKLQWLHTVFIRDFSAEKSLQLVCQAAEFKFESKLKPLLVIWQSILNAILENNGRFDCGINSRVSRAALRHSLGPSWAGQTGKHEHRAFPTWRQ